MPIDISAPDSPGWWLNKLAIKRRNRLPRLELLNSYREGNPPLPTEVEAAREAFRNFQEMSCTNFAALITGSVSERISVRDVRTAVSGSEVDEEAQVIWKDNGLDIEFADVLENMLDLGDGYIMVGLDSDSGELIITGEDPRQVVTIHNPVKQREVRAASKTFHDPDAGKDYIYLYLKGEWDKETGTFLPAKRYVASRKARRSQPGMEFSKNTYDWDEDFGGADGEELPHHLVPVIRFRNKRGVGDFEPHLRLLNRINHTIFQRMVIALYQAFKQRAIYMDEEEAEDGEGNDVSLDDVLTSDPGSWIQLPSNAKIWESGQADMSGIRGAIKDDVMHLAAVTRRPMAIFAPDNESAAGAEFNREGLTFATEDKINRATQGLVDLFHLIFLTLGDSARAKRSDIIIGWNPTERHSLSDRFSAASQANGSLAKKSIWREILQKTPEEIKQLQAELAEELLLGETFNDSADTA